MAGLFEKLSTLTPRRRHGNAGGVGFLRKERPEDDLRALGHRLSVPALAACPGLAAGRVDAQVDLAPSRSAIARRAAFSRLRARKSSLAWPDPDGTSSATCTAPPRETSGPLPARRNAPRERHKPKDGGSPTQATCGRRTERTTCGIPSRQGDPSSAQSLCGSKREGNFRRELARGNRRGPAGRTGSAARSAFRLDADRRGARHHASGARCPGGGRCAGGRRHPDLAAPHGNPWRASGRPPALALSRP